MEDNQTVGWEEINVSEEAENGAPKKPNFPQVFAAVAVCYFCIIGGNLQGYTSSAIPSMKQSLATPPDDNVALYNDSAGDETMAQVIWENKQVKGNLLQHYLGHGPGFRNLSNVEASWISGLSPLGAFVGSIVAPLPLNRLGPRGAVISYAGPTFLISWLLTAFAPSLTLIYLGRFIGGTAIGVSTSCAPVYIIDTAPINLRGPLGTLPQCFFVVGILISFVIGAFLEWRETALVCATLTIPGIFLLLLIPESPKWLLCKRRVKQAEKSYFRLNGYTLKSVSEFFLIKQDYVPLADNRKEVDLNENQDKLVSSIDKTNTSKASLGSRGNADSLPSKKNRQSSLSFLFHEPGVFKATCVVFGLMTFQQVTGINGVNFYTVTIFNDALGSDVAVINGHLSSVVVAGTLVLATWSSVYLIEKLGRKVLLLSSMLFMALGAISIGSFFYIKENHQHLVSSIVWLPLISLVVFVVAFSIGYGPVCWIIGAEILHPKIRATLNPVAVGFNWFFVFAIAKTYPDLVDLLGASGTFWLYGGLALVGLVFTYVCVPETKGKSEQQIQLWFRKPRTMR